MKTVVELLHEGAKNHGDMPYLGGKTDNGWVTFNFKEVDRLSSVFAAMLIKKGFKKGENISILSEGRPSWVICEFGLLKAGCTSVPLSTKLSEDEIVFRLDHSESKAFLVSENNFQKAVTALKTARSKPVLIVISDKNEALAGDNVLFYDDLILEGEKLLSQESEY